MGREKAGMKCIGTVLGEPEYQTLYNMFHSKDEADWLVGQQVLNGCVIKDSIYWIWRLTRKHWPSNFVNLRTKASREFSEACNLFGIVSQNEEQFAMWLNTKGWMTPWIFQQLKAEIKKLIAKRADNRFFNISCEIHEKYLELDPHNVREYITVANDKFN